MNTGTRQHERQVERSSESRAAAERRNRVNKFLQQTQNAEHQDVLTDRMDDALFSDMGQTETQAFMHDLGGGISKGPPRGGWPVFDSITGRRLASGVPTSFPTIQ